MTTNNRMELSAVIEAMEPSTRCPSRPVVTVRSDSKYVVDAFNQGWINQRNGWLTAGKKPVATRTEYREVV